MSLEVTIAKRFEGFTLHADFAAGNTAAAILGASGCGKSMTLRCIAGVVKPDSGRIVLDGRVLFDSEKGIDLPPQQRNVGLLFQNYALFPNMTVEQNILCALKKEKDPAARKAACGSALRAMRLDEPFSALDSYLREEVEGEVGSLLSNFDGTALLVTHDRDEAYRLCREMIVMDGGEVLRAGTTKEVFADPRRLTAARLTGCKNILPCVRVDEHHVRLTGWERELTVALPVPEGCCAVGIRAHDFAPEAADGENRMPVQVGTSSENPFDWNVICTAADDTGKLWWKASKTTLSSPPPQAPAYLRVAPENIMPLV